MNGEDQLCCCHFASCSLHTRIILGFRSLTVSLDGPQLAPISSHEARFEAYDLCFILQRHLLIEVLDGQVPLTHQAIYPLQVPLERTSWLDVQVVEFHLRFDCCLILCVCHTRIILGFLSSEDFVSHSSLRLFVGFDEEFPRAVTPCDIVLSRLPIEEHPHEFVTGGVGGYIFEDDVDGGVAHTLIVLGFLEVLEQKERQDVIHPVLSQYD